jgi:RNA polymerase sigma-70 factor (ECF subfamily)
MFAIARNAFLDHTRRDRVRRAVVRATSRSSAEGPAQAPAETRGDEVVAARDTLVIVRAALDKLPMRQREAFVLLRFEGLSVRDAAQVLGATESTVKVRAFRAYEAIRNALEQEGAGSLRQR